MSDNREGVEKDGEKTGTKQGENEQMLYYFMDGTSRHLVHFDRLKEDAGYAGAIESAAKLVRTGGKITLKVTSATWNSLKFNVLWEKSGSPPQFVWA